MSLTELFLQYGLFFLKTATVVIAVLFVVANSVAAMMRAKKSEGILVIEKLNAKFDTARHTIQREVLSKSAYKKVLKAEKKEHKQQLKQQSGAADGNPRQRLFVICFDGDIKASAVEALRHQVNAILLSATSADEVVVILESPGGVVHGYGLAASQLHRFKDNKIKLTVAVDKVAASGGYMMACVADHIMAAPFAILGSIGVVAQIPNFHRWLQDRNVDIEHFTAGEYKRTLTLLAETPKKGAINSKKSWKKRMISSRHLSRMVVHNSILKKLPPVNIGTVHKRWIWALLMHCKPAMTICYRRAKMLIYFSLTIKSRQLSVSA